MYFTTGARTNFKNLAVLATMANPKFKAATADELKAGYLAYIDMNQPSALLSERPFRRPIRITGASNLRKLANPYQEKSKLNDLVQETFIELEDHSSFESTEERVEAAFQDLRTRDPHLGALCDIVFNYYFLARSKKAAGGSTSGGMGILWLNPRETWSHQDYLEMIVHELTHQLLFIDERRFNHYPRYDLISDPRTFAYSSILNRSRPLDKVVHSLFVAINVAQFRRLQTAAEAVLHPRLEKLISSARETLTSLARLSPELFSPRLHELLALAEKQVAVFERDLHG